MLGECNLFKHETAAACSGLNETRTLKVPGVRNRSISDERPPRISDIMRDAVTAYSALALSEGR